MMKEQDPKLDRSNFRVMNLDKSMRKDAAKSEGVEMHKIQGDVKESQQSVSMLV